MPASTANSTSPLAARNARAVASSVGWKDAIARPCDATRTRIVSGARRTSSISRRCSLVVAKDTSAASRHACFCTTRLHRWVRPRMVSTAYSPAVPHRHFQYRRRRFRTPTEVTN